jgi:D-alanyl-D-alanine carboxypeptidase
MIFYLEGEEMVLHRAILEIAAPYITAQSWVISDRITGRIIFARDEHFQKEVASLTKIMTCILAIDLCSRLGKDVYSELIEVS